MNIRDMYNDVSSTFSQPAGYNEVVGAFNTIIRRINAEMELPDQAIDITEQWTTPWADWSDYAWEDLDSTTERWDRMTRFTQGFYWDADEYSLTVPRNIVKVTKVYVDDIEYDCVGWDEMKAKDSGDRYFSQVGRKLYFIDDIESGTNEIFMECKQLYPQIDGDDYTSMPENFYALLVNGAIYMLSVKPKYKNDNLTLIYKEAFDREWLSLTDQILNQEVRRHIKSKYTF
jgi:hypothetical protein